MKKCFLCKGEENGKCFTHGISVCENCYPACKSCNSPKCPKCWGGKECAKCGRWICKFCAEESQKISHFKYAVFCNDCLFERLEEIRRKEEERRQREIDEEYANWAK
jgi:hypothetical protein